MKKILYAVLFMVATLIAGLFVVQNSWLKRVENYYKGEAINYYRSNEQESYVDVRLYSMGATKYLNKYLYKYQVNDGVTSFDFNIYHYEISVSDEPKYAIFFEIFNFKTTKEIDNLWLTITDGSIDNFVQENINVYNYKYLDSWFSSAFIEYDSTNEINYFNFSDASRRLNYIEKIIISTNQSNKDKLLTIESDDSANIIVGSDILVNNSLSNNFNGNSNSYENLKSLYENETNYSKPSLLNLNKYNGVLIRNIIIYVLAVLVLMFVAFFRKPLYEYRERKKIEQRLTNKQ